MNFCEQAHHIQAAIFINEPVWYQKWYSIKSVYFGNMIQCDGEDIADVKHRMEIAQSVFSSLSHIWSDHCLPRSMKLRLYHSDVCSTLTHACEAWNLAEKVIKRVNGFNSRCLHVITKADYRETATNPPFNLVLAIHQRKIRSWTLA